MDFVSSRRRLEDLPSDGAKAIDVISGSLFRIFQRIEELNAAVARLGRRIAVLEQPPAAPVAPEPVKLATPQPVRHSRSARWRESRNWRFSIWRPRRFSAAEGAAATRQTARRAR